MLPKRSDLLVKNHFIIYSKDRHKDISVQVYVSKTFRKLGQNSLDGTDIIFLIGQRNVAEQLGKTCYDDFWLWLFIA